MSENKTPTKEQILEAIRKLKNNPDDKLGILADIGIGAVGAVGAGYAASILGASAIFFGLIPVAAPLAVVAGGAILGGAALVGAKRILFDGTYRAGERAEILRQLEEQLRDVESKERASSLRENDKNKFHIFLEEPVRHELITPQDAQNLMKAVEAGQMSLKEAYQLVYDLIKSEDTGEEVAKDLNSQQLHRSDAEKHYKQGMEKGKGGKYKEAIEEFTKAIGVHRNYAEAYKYRGIAHLKMEEQFAALRDFQTAADLFLKQGNTEDYQDVLNRMKNLY